MLPVSLAESTTPKGSEPKGPWRAAVIGGIFGAVASLLLHADPTVSLELTTTGFVAGTVFGLVRNALIRR